jgi:2-dehydropantoate 2-reductase
MRYIIYGAGAIGGVIGGQLAQAGQDVVLIARGAHLAALRAGGLRLVTPGGELQPPVRVVGSPAEVGFEAGDIVLLAVKSQDTEAAVSELDAAATREVSVICAQNGVDNERVVLRRRAATYGMCIVLPATHLEPGVVIVHAAPVSGILDVGRYPHGVDEVSERVAADLSAATFDARAEAQVMRWKYAKLLGNLGNALDAACGPEGRRSHLYDMARAEGEACCAAAGIEYASLEEEQERRAALMGARATGEGGAASGASGQAMREAGPSAQAAGRGAQGAGPASGPSGQEMREAGPTAHAAGQGAQGASQGMSQASQVSQASGQVSPASGQVSPASGQASPASGQVSPASGQVSPASGQAIPAFGQAMHSAGQGSHRGSSSWQSLARGTGTIEADWLNGEIVLLGRLHGVPTPVNEVLRRVANRMARDHLPPGSWSIERIDEKVRQLKSRDILHLI